MALASRSASRSLISASFAARILILISCLSASRFITACAARSSSRILSFSGKCTALIIVWLTKFPNSNAWLFLRISRSVSSASGVKRTVCLRFSLFFIGLAMVFTLFLVDVHFRTPSNFWRQGCGVRLFSSHFLPSFFYPSIYC